MSRLQCSQAAVAAKQHRLESIVPSEKCFWWGCLGKWKSGCFCEIVGVEDIGAIAPVIGSSFPSIIVPCDAVTRQF